MTRMSLTIIYAENKPNTSKERKLLKLIGLLPQGMSDPAELPAWCNHDQDLKSELFIPDATKIHHYQEMFPVLNSVLDPVTTNI